MVADFIISIVNFFIAKLILPLLPTNMPFFPIDTLLAILNSDLKSDVIYAFSGFGKIFPLDLTLIVFLTIISAEISLVLIKMAMYLINLVRGSGA
jgi:hypothetical protein